MWTTTQSPTLLHRLVTSTTATAHPIRHFSTSPPLLSLPPVPVLPALSSPEDMKAARDWIVAFEKVRTEEIPRTSLEISYSRSSGPGGQNVNKISSKALLRFPLSPYPSFLPLYLIPSLSSSPYHTATPAPNGSLLISSSTHRTAPLNLEEGYRKLKATILEAAGEGLRGETSEGTKKRVEGLVKGEKMRIRKAKEGRKGVKSGRREGGGGGGGYD